MSRALGILALCLAACYSPSQPECGFICGPNGECPEDYTCDANTNRCRRDGATRGICEGLPQPGPFDAPEGIDSPPDADVTPPSLLSATPLPNATGVSRAATIAVVFNEPVMNVGVTTFQVADNAAPVAGTVAETTPFDGTTYRFTPNPMLSPNTSHTVRLDGAITDRAGNSLTPSPTTYTFETGS